MSTASPDYKTVFEIAKLTPIHSEPTFETIQKLSCQLQVNVQYVHSNLGGGAHGHLGLVLSPTQYTLHSNVPYRKPTNPGMLVILAGTTQHMTLTLRDQDTEILRVFREMHSIEQSLRQQLVAAIEPQYLEALRDVNIGRISAPIYTILKHLTDLYGKITPQQLMEYETQVRNMTFDVANPIDGIFSTVDELCNYAEAANTPYTQLQTINFVYVILNKTGLFQ